MGIAYVCDMCGRRMAESDEQRYIFKMEVYAAAPILEITQEDLEKDHSAEIRRLIEELRQQHPDEVDEAVYRAFHYDLCRSCQRKIINDPLVGLRGGGAG